MDTKYIKNIFFIYIIFYCCTLKKNGIKAKISVVDDYKLKYDGEKNDKPISNIQGLNKSLYKAGVWPCKALKNQQRKLANLELTAY